MGSSSGRGAVILRGRGLPRSAIPRHFERPAFDAAHKNQLGPREADVAGDRRIRRQLLQKGLLGPSFSQFVVLPAHVDREKKKEQGREKNGAPEKEHLLEVLAVRPAGRGGLHPVMVA